MSRVMCKLDGTAKTDLVFAILAMNAFRKLREDTLRLLLRWRRWLVITHAVRGFFSEAYITNQHLNKNEHYIRA